MANMKGFQSLVTCAFFFINIYCVSVGAVPPEACFANFRWDDCGKPPQPVIYYWKPGSRCEVGIWRGCLPNMNMFADEYECVSTCIFTPRAMPEDYHNHNNELEEVLETSTDSELQGNVTVSENDSNNTTDSNKTTDSNTTADNKTAVGNETTNINTATDKMKIEGGNETTTVMSNTIGDRHKTTVGITTVDDNKEAADDKPTD